jgi:ATP-dependent 26S proteasome regulatory subunit
MSEVNAMTVDEIVARTRELESEIRKAKTTITRLGNEGKNLDVRIKENKEKLNMAQQLPHMVANVGEILDNDDDEDEDKDGFR